MSNVALVVLDTLRKDFFDEFFDWLPGVRFENAWSTAHYTVPSHASLFTGKYPRELGVHAKSEQFDCPDAPLSEKLRRSGYKTRGICGNMLLSINGFDRGFDEFHHTGRVITLNDHIFPWNSKIKDTSNPTPFGYLSLIAECMVSDYETWESMKYGWRIKRDEYYSIEDTIESYEQMEIGDNEFLFVNLMDVHSPYIAPKEYRTTTYEHLDSDAIIDISADQLDNQITSYEDTVRYLSDRYQDLFTMMKRDYDYIITVSDHGELFGEHGLCKHPYGVYPELTHIPLSIYHENGCVSDQPIEETVSLLDVHRTIQAITGVTGESRGQNLLEAVTGGTYLVESQGPRGSVIENLKEAGVDQETLSNADQPLRGIVTPENYYGYQLPDGTYVEQGNSTDSDARSRLQELLDSIEMKEGSERSGEEEITEDVEVHLRDLGYR